MNVAEDETWGYSTVSMFLWLPLYHSVQFSCSVMSDSLQPYESQHARPPCPSPTPGVYSNSCPSSRWCRPAISSSVAPFSSCPQSLPASRSFPISQLFAWGGHSTGVSASASVLPMNSQDWSPLEWTGWISLQSKGLSRVFSNIVYCKVISLQLIKINERKKKVYQSLKKNVFSNTTVQKHLFFGTQLSLQSNSHIHTLLPAKEIVYGPGKASPIQLYYAREGINMIREWAEDQDFFSVSSGSSKLWSACYSSKKEETSKVIIIKELTTMNGMFMCAWVCVQLTHIMRNLLNFTNWGKLYISYISYIS